MIISTRSHNTTKFTLYWSHINSAFIFNRTDGNGLYNTETAVLESRNEKEAKEYFEGKVSFYCKSYNINKNDMLKG